MSHTNTAMPYEKIDPGAIAELRSQHAWIVGLIYRVSGYVLTTSFFQWVSFQFTLKKTAKLPASPRRAIALASAGLVLSARRVSNANRNQNSNLRRSSSLPQSSCTACRLATFLRVTGLMLALGILNSWIGVNHFPKFDRDSNMVRPLTRLA